MCVAVVAKWLRLAREIEAEQAEETGEEVTIEGAEIESRIARLEAMQR